MRYEYNSLKDLFEIMEKQLHEAREKIENSLPFDSDELTDDIYEVLEMLDEYKLLLDDDLDMFEFHLSEEMNGDYYSKGNSKKERAMKVAKEYFKNAKCYVIHVLVEKYERLINVILSLSETLEVKSFDDVCIRALTAMFIHLETEHDLTAFKNITKEEFTNKYT